jgi:hypothetical protein
MGDRDLGAWKWHRNGAPVAAMIVLIIFTGPVTLAVQ